MRKAFTLIELLVVIAIVAVLAAILFPVFAKARRLGYRTQCISNLHQIGLAFDSYMVDWDNKYPWAHSTNQAWTGALPVAPAWYDILQPYVKNRDIFKCPSDTGETWPNTGFHQRTPPFSSETFLRTSYDYPGIAFPGVSLAGKSTGFVKQPTISPLSMEGRPWHENYDPNVWDPKDDPALMNVLYCDGHVTRQSWKAWKSQLTDSYK